MNIKRILSRTSLNSSLSGRNRPQVEECTNHTKYEEHEIKDEIITLKAALKYKEDALDATVKDKDNIYLDLKKSRKCIRYLYQKIIDERFIF